MNPTIPVDVLKQAISYFYLLAYSPPEQAADFQTITTGLRKGLADKAGMPEDVFFQAVTPEVFRRIASFHLDKREPDSQVMRELVDSASQAGMSAEALAVYQSQMAKVASLKARSHPDNRLHRKKGCAFCRQPCAYGYFSLVSEPDFKVLNRMLQEEKQRPKGEQNPLRPVLGFTLAHLARVSRSLQGMIQRSHLGNMAYCLLLLSMAKSRMALPEKEIKVFQAHLQVWTKSDVTIS